MFLSRCVAGSLMLSLFPFHRRPSQSASRSGEQEFVFVSPLREPPLGPGCCHVPTRGH